MAATPPTSPTTARRATPGGTGGRSTPVLVPQEALAGQPDVPLNRAVTTVGSGETCRLVLQSRTISRHHAVFLVDGPTAFVADLASRTGVLVNGKPVREAELNAGDRVQIGKFVFRYRPADGPAPAPTPTAPPASAVVTGLLAVPLHGRIALVGRRETSDVALVGDAAVSAAHAALFHAAGQWYVRDLGSRTGTAVNGQPIVQQALNFGDRITVGAATIQFESAVAVPGHAALAVAPTLGMEPPAPLPTEVAPDPLPFPLDAADNLSVTPPPAMPFGLVAATDHPFAAVLTAAEAPIPVADETAPADVAVAPDPLADALPGTDLPDESPPLPQPRAWDAVDVNDPPMPAPAAEVSPVPPEPRPRSWDEVLTPADESHGRLAAPTLPAPIPEPEPTADVASLADPALAVDDTLAGDGSEPLSFESEPTPPFEEASAPVDETVAPLPFEPEVEPLPLDLLPAADAEPLVEAPPATDWDESAVPDSLPDSLSDGLPVTDVVEPTEPSPESALAWEAEVAAEGDVAEVPVVDESLSDSQFGRQVDDFAAADTTGPLVETPPDPPPTTVDSAGAPDVHPGLPAAQAVPVVNTLMPSRPVPPELLADVPDFVFVPGDATPAADVIFWGDPDLDAVAEAAVIGAAVVAPPAVEPIADDVASEVADADVPPAPYVAQPYAAEPVTADAAVDVAHLVTDGSAEPAQELDVADADPASRVSSPDVGESTDRADLPVEMDAHTDAGILAPADTAGPLDADLSADDPEETADPADAPLTVAAADSLAAGPSTAETLADFDDPVDDRTLDGITGEPADVMPAGDGEGPVATSTAPRDFFLDDEPAAVTAEAVDALTPPPVLTEDLDPALAVTAADAHPTAGTTAVQPIAFDDLLADLPAAAGVPPHAELALDLPDEATESTEAADDDWASDGHAMGDVDDVLPAVAVASDGPIGFEPDPDDEVASADWDDLDLLDDSPVAEALQPASVTDVDLAERTDADAAVELAPTAEDFGAVVNVDGGLAVGLSATEPAVLAPVTEFSAVGDGAAVDTFAAVTDAALAGPHGGPAVADATGSFGFPADDEVTPAEVQRDDSAVADVTPDEPASPPVDAAVDLADEAVPADAPALVETVPPAADDDAAPPVGELQLLASVSIPPPPDELPAEALTAGDNETGMSGPSLFGFNFEGGSFLGGMPLPLTEGSAPSPLPPGGIVYDAPLPIEAESSGDGPSGSAQAEPAPAEDPADDLADDAGPPRVRPVTPPGLVGLVGASVEPSRPVLPVGLTTAGGASRALPPPPVPPPGFADLGNGRSRSGDVFSQASGSIGVVEAFGDRPGRAEQYQIPEVDRSAPPGAALAAARGDLAAPIVPPPAPRLANAERLIPADLPKRKKVRRLVVAAFVLPLVWAGLVYLGMGRSATVVGTLRFDGLDAQGQSAQRLFKGDQVTRLYGDDVRSTARAMLAGRGQPTGPTEDAAAMSRAMQDQVIKPEWGPNEQKPTELKLTYTTADARAGKAQVAALLSALRAKDEAMSDVRARAAQELAAARDASAAAKATDDQVRAAWKEQVRLAQDRPDKATVDALDRTLEAANQRVASVQAERAATESVMAGWQRQDPAKPVDPAIDTEATNIQRQLVPIQAQIAKAKQLAQSNGGGGGGDDDPLMAVLQQQADRLKAKLDRRQLELQRDASIPPEERARQRETAIEQLGVKVAAMRREEAAALTTAASAAAAAADAHAKVDAARIADGKAQDLYARLMEADIALKQASDDQAEKQRAVDGTVVVAGPASTNPQVTVPLDTDPRPMTAGVGAAVILTLVVGWLLAVAGTGEGPGDGPSDYAPADEDDAPAHNREPLGV